MLISCLFVCHPFCVVCPFPSTSVVSNVQKYSAVLNNAQQYSIILSFCFVLFTNCFSLALQNYMYLENSALAGIIGVDSMFSLVLIEDKSRNIYPKKSLVYKLFDFWSLVFQQSKKILWIKLQSYSGPYWKKLWVQKLTRPLHMELRIP